MNANKHEFGKSGESKTMGFEMRMKNFVQKTKKFEISNTDDTDQRAIDFRISGVSEDQW
jgi:hypothetical protein